MFKFWNFAMFLLNKTHLKMSSAEFGIKTFVVSYESYLPHSKKEIKPEWLQANLDSPHRVQNET